MSEVDAGCHARHSICELPDYEVSFSSVSSIHRGGGGQVAVQAQEILRSLADSLTPHWVAVREALQYDPRMRFMGLISKLTGIDKETCRRQLHRLEERGGEPVIVQDSGGRRRAAAKIMTLDGKRLSDIVDLPSSSCDADEDMPDIELDETCFEDGCDEEDTAAGFFFRYSQVPIVCHKAFFLAIKL